MTVEVWRPVVGYEGLYEVSNMGRLRSLRAWWDGPRIMRLKPRKLYAYVETQLTDARGVTTHRLVHRLVLEAFVRPPEPGEEGDHKDLNPANNALDNLQWVTPQANKEKRRYPKARLTAEQVRAIRERDGKHREIASEFGVTKTVITRIKNGEGYAWV